MTPPRRLHVSISRDTAAKLRRASRVLLRQPCAEDGVAWVLGRWRPFTVVSLSLRVDSAAVDVSGAYDHHRRVGGRRRATGRITAVIPSRYPVTTRHTVTGVDWCRLADEAEASVYILGHETWHAGNRGGEDAAERRALSWVDQWRAAIDARRATVIR